MLQLSVRQLIADRYAAAHGASPTTDYPAYCIVQGPHGPRATLGLRRAGEERLFLEAYLDAPVETLLGARFGRTIERDRIVEIGGHASGQPQATVRLWASVARMLAGEAEIAVAVLTGPLRRMFRRLGLPIVELAPARPDRIGAALAAWGRYYESDPLVCAGEIEASRAILSRWEAPREAAA